MSLPALHRSVSVAARRARSEGFTAIEMMIVIALMAILAALALPGFRDALERYRSRRAVEDLTSTIYMARAEAIKRGGRVAIITNPAGPAGCQSWSCGWVVIADTNENGALDADEMVLQSAIVPTGVLVRKTSGSATLNVNRWGDIGGAGFLSFSFASKAFESETAFQSVICMSSGGRLKTAMGVTACP